MKDFQGRIYDFQARNFFNSNEEEGVEIFINGDCIGQIQYLNLPLMDGDSEENDFVIHVEEWLDEQEL